MVFKLMHKISLQQKLFRFIKKKQTKRSIKVMTFWGRRGSIQVHMKDNSK